MIFVTGDIHGEHSIRKFNSHEFPEGIHLSKNDYVICTGDFGLIWDVGQSSSSEQYWIDWLTNKPWTTLFVDGNHENHFRLNAFPRLPMFGGTVGVVNDSIFHLRRGEVYTIEDSKFFTFGGAHSIDKLERKENVSWWTEELPSDLDIENAYKNLEKHNYDVEYVLTHTAPAVVIKMYFPFFRDKQDCPTAELLNDIHKKIKFRKWYFGHFHKEMFILDKYICQFDSIQRIK